MERNNSWRGQGGGGGEEGGGEEGGGERKRRDRGSLAEKGEDIMT